MTIYRVGASIRDARHKEVRNLRTLWNGDAADPRQAIVSAHAALGPILKDEPRADTIVLHIHDPKGGVTTTTEYAEDFLIGKGASLGTALLDEHSDHGLSAEETADAKRALEAKALLGTPYAADILSLPLKGYGQPKWIDSIDCGNSDPVEKLRFADLVGARLIRVVPWVFSKLLDEHEINNGKTMLAPDGSFSGIAVEVTREPDAPDIQIIYGGLKSNSRPAIPSDMPQFGLPPSDHKGLIIGRGQIYP